MTPLISTNWLLEHYQDDNLVLLDASLQKTVDEITTQHENASIPSSRYFDLKGNFSEQSSAFPNTIPTPEQFEVECQKLGINQHSKIIVFDNKGVYSSPRVWWMFKVMGHEEVSVLDGGLPEWIKEGHPTQSRCTEAYKQGDFKATLNSAFIKSYEDILDNIDQKSFTIVDARSEGRFNGTQTEPRKHLKSGNIPNSVNIPYTTLLDNGKFKSNSALKTIFESKMYTDDDLTFSCGSGLTACIVMLAYELAYSESRFLYDGSWTEWAERQNLIVN